MIKWILKNQPKLFQKLSMNNKTTLNMIISGICQYIHTELIIIFKTLLDKMNQKILFPGILPK
jgi:hypothetical protein